MVHATARQLTAQARASDAGGDSSGWIRAHEELSRLAKCRALLEWEEGRGLLAALRAGVHRHLGFASFVEYVESLFGYKPRSIEEKVRVAEALEKLPLLNADLREGGLSWSAVRELTRVATMETESAWRGFATGKSVRQIENRVSGRKPGDGPDSPGDPALRRHVLAFEVRAETLATFREALSKVRRDAGGPLDEDSSLLLMARHVLGGPAHEGRANYQIAYTVCEDCGRGFQQARGEQVEVEPALVRMATCDAQYIGHVGATHSQPVSSLERTQTDEAKPTAADRAHVGAITPAPHANEDTTAFDGNRNEPALIGAHVGDSPIRDPARADRTSSHQRAHVGGVSAPDCVQVGDSPSRDPAREQCSSLDRAHVGEWLDRGHVGGARKDAPPRAARPLAPAPPQSGDSAPDSRDGDSGALIRVSRAAENRVTNHSRLGSQGGVGRPGRGGVSPETPRAKQSIPPAARRLVVRRDSKKCVVPGCNHATFLDVHHLELRSEGGGHAPDWLIVLCGAHHRALHRGQLLVEGSVAKGLVFRHADGSIYRGAVSPRAVAAQTQAFAALRRLGFRESEARRALDRVRAEVSLDHQDPEQVVRAALRMLTTAHPESLKAL